MMSLGVAIAGHAVRPAGEADFAACNRLCRRVHGHDRAGELAGAVQRGVATLVEHDNRITGYATEIGFFGHAVGETDEDIKALLGAAEVFTGPDFLLPLRHTHLFRWRLEHGLHVNLTATLMSQELYSEPTGAFLPSILY